MCMPHLPDPDPAAIPPGHAGIGPREEQLLGISIERIARSGNAGLVVTVSGEIDLATVGRFRTAVAEGLDRVAEETPNGAPLIIDLTNVTFLGSPGLQALVEATRAAHRRREPLRIVVDHTRPVIRPIELTGLDDLLTLHDAVDGALQAGIGPGG